MLHPRIKICGITTVEDAELTMRSGADAIGMNFYKESKRAVTSEMVTRISQVIQPFVEPVLLFVNENLHHAIATAERVSTYHTMHTIQWHGHEPPQPPPPPWKFIPAFSIADAAGLDRVAAYLNSCRALGQMPSAVLLDGLAAGQYGGTGNTAPWRLLADFDPGVPVILAGGLTPENVAEAIRIVRPYAVDVASGVENAPGRKDPDKLRRFIDAVRSV